MPTLKGAFINLGAGLLGALPNIIVFQFNPDQVSRTPALIQPPRQGDGSGMQEAAPQPDEPSETMSFTLRLDATDQLAERNPIAVDSGILPTLSALELLMVPRQWLEVNLIKLSGLAAQQYLHPPEKLPTVLFFWGPTRIVPVTINSLSINETQYDTRLNPVRAEVSVSLQALTRSQLAADSPYAMGAYRYTRRVKEVMAALNLQNAAEIGPNPVLSFPI